MTTTKHKPFWATIHKWVGLVISILIVMFCFSGLIMNHRSLFSSFSVSRQILPSEYHIKNYNNGVIKGTLRLDDGRVLAFGNTGVWLTDSVFSVFSDFNSGLPEGIDNRNIRNVVKAGDGTLWCAAQFGVYRHDGSVWENVNLPKCKERIADMTLSKDSRSVIVLSRSAVYVQSNNQFSRIEIGKPDGYVQKVTMFKTLWMLHSGELFGLPGRIIVDILAIVLIFLSLSGIILFVLPYSIRATYSSGKLKLAKLFKWNFKWHDRVGYTTIILTIIVAFTGMCLRPPLMIPFVLTSTAPMPGTALDSENVWHDKLRGIRWDDSASRWLISTSEGFISTDECFTTIPVLLNQNNIPPISPMGITVFEPYSSNEWLIGSFSGMYIWNPQNNKVKNFFTGKDYVPGKALRPTSDYLISGYSKDLNGQDVVFDYATGCSADLPMHDAIKNQPMSLWNFALELHVGRCYNPVLGPFSALFIFVSGLILITVLVSGLVLHRRYKIRKH